MQMSQSWEESLSLVNKVSLTTFISVVDVFLCLQSLRVTVKLSHSMFRPWAVVDS